MREIKLRGFSKYDNKMRNINRINFNNDNLMFEGMNLNWSKNETVIMQYTGLKDCNGVEVYEGDVVENFLTDRFKIKYIEDKARFSIGEDNINKSIIKSEEIKVIGNIYENPELLLEK